MCVAQIFSTDEGGKGFVSFIWTNLVNLFKGGEGVVFGIDFFGLDEFGIVASLPIACLFLHGCLSGGRHDQLPN